MRSTTAVASAARSALSDCRWASTASIISGVSRALESAIVCRTRSAASGPRAAAAPVETFGEVEVHRASRTVERAGEPVALTPKEYDLLLALMNRSGAVTTRHELLSEVWGYQSDVSTRTVDIHVSELRRKLEKTPAEPKHILTVRKTGYRFEP